MLTIGNTSRPLLCLTAIWLSLAIIPSALAVDEAKAQLRAGAYAIDITPEHLPVLVNGGMYSRTSERIVDRLHARCLVLDDGTIQIAIVVVDSCMVPRDLLDDARQLASLATKIPTAHMLISATHTHSAPAAMGCLGTDRDERYAQVPARAHRPGDSTGTGEPRTGADRLGVGARPGKRLLSPLSDERGHSANQPLQRQDQRPRADEPGAQQPQCPPANGRR